LFARMPNCAKRNEYWSASCLIRSLEPCRCRDRHSSLCATRLRVEFAPNRRGLFFPVEHSRLFTENLLQGRTANILFIGNPECILVDASGKFFAHFQFQFRWRIQS
jgi:hypothetical protein